MKKIVITGGLGYIGMELAKVYSGKAKDYKIYVLDNEFHPGRVSRLNKWGIKFVQCDILDKVKLKPFIEEADIIFHLAGITDVPTTSDDIDINHDKLVSKVGIKGSQNIINLASKNAKIIFPSTHVVFEGLDKITKNINEKHLPSPELNYSIGTNFPKIRWNIINADNIYH